MSSNLLMRDKLLRYNLSSIFIVIVSITVFSLLVISQFYNVDFGKFEPDYFLAHNLAMVHLHGNESFVELLRTIPNSASGVLPLWLLGFFEGIIVHRIIWYFVIALTFFVIWTSKSPLNFKLYFIWSLCLSPMLMSALAWVLPEIFALFLVILVNAMVVRSPRVAFLTAPLVPLSRQTFIVFLFGRTLLGPKNRKLNLGLLIGSTLALLFLFIIWGGLVPPKLRGVHLSPSLKAPIIALLIFSLYMFVHNIATLYTKPFSKRRLLLSMVISILIVWVGLMQIDLRGGGYIFSRLEAWSLPLSFVLESVLLTLLFYSLQIPIIVYLLLVSFSFVTTNFMFLKYVDFYFFGLLAIGLSDISSDFLDDFESLAISGLLFQIFSLIVAVLYY